jgi:hypothetical protein
MLVGVEGVTAGGEGAGWESGGGLSREREDDVELPLTAANQRLENSLKIASGELL